MRSHPFIQSMLHILVSILLIIVTCLSLTWALENTFYYMNTWKTAFVQAVIVTSVWSVVLYYSWYLYMYIKYWSGRVVIGTFLQAFNLLVFYIAFVVLGVVEEPYFISEIPFLLITGSLIWIIGMQWFASQEKELNGEETTEIADLLPEEEKREVIQSLSVKSGSRIHIIPVREIYYIQACGDYVNIFATEGQFIKEQTMKSLEATLPETFIRIHRSSIINTGQLLRIELFGKENYHVHLKNGETLKASLSGYKLLKQRLNL